ncbi:ABC transporter permease [Bifidobacterium moukalabense]|uniref:ABC transporter permease n=1 Tax=Bifidobacterium moukalabense TaxID=1333651 RepID=UPI0010F6755E|nr:FtsX-like permease family protein [Bifidobacterium moukalabense]
MWSITMKLMRKTMRMLIPAGIAIVIGTAFIASTFLFGNAMNDSLSRQATSMFGGANYAISPATDGLDENELNDVYSTTVGDFHLDRMNGIEGVNGVRVAMESGVTVSKGDNHVSGEAITTARNGRLLPVDITEGNQPIDNNEVALPGSVMKQLGVNIGDTVTLTSRYATDDEGGKAQATDVRVVGVTSDPNGTYSYYGGAVVASDDLIARMQGADDFNSAEATTVYLDLAKDGNTVSAKTIREVNRLLPKHFNLMSRQEVGDAYIKGVGVGETSIVTIFLLCFGVLAMLVAALVIANTFQVLVAQRRRTLALLRTIGAKKGQLYASVLLESCLLGLIASILGVALGSALMGAACASGIMRQGMHLIFSWQVFVVPIVFGVIMTVLASLGSARSATSVTPLEALRPLELTDDRRSGRARAIIGMLFTVVGIALAAFSVWQMQTIGDADMLNGSRFVMILLAAIAGAGLVFLGLVLTAVFWLPVLMKGVGALVSMSGPSAKVAHANIQKNPRRIAATGAALLIGVTLVSTIATGATSAKETMNNALATRYSVDVVATGSDISRQMANAIREIKGVTDVVYAPSANVQLKDSDGNVSASTLLIGVKNIDELKKVMRVDLGDSTINADTVLMPQYNAQSGERMTFGQGDATFGTAWDENGDTKRTLELKVRQADYRRISSAYGAVGFVDESHFTNGDLDTNSHTLLVRINETGSTLGSVFDSIQSALSKSLDVAVSGPIAERVQWGKMIDSMMMLMVGLIAVAVLIALVGVANTLSLSVIERTRESATLRAIGMTRGQLRRSLGVEALLISLVSGVVGVVLGTLFGWLGSYVVFSTYGSVVFPFEWGINGIVLGVAAVAALLASVFPARRAVKTPPVEALAEA